MLWHRFVPAGNALRNDGALSPLSAAVSHLALRPLSAAVFHLAMRPLSAISGHFVLAVFVVLQCADGIITFQAVTAFGATAEGNPLLATWIVMIGAGPALLGAKLVACACAALLHRCGHHRILGGLALVYVVLAVGPWLHVLTVIAREP